MRRLGPDPLYQEQHRQDAKDAHPKQRSGRELDRLNGTQDAHDQSADDKEELVLHGLAEELALVVAQPDLASFPARASGADEEHNTREEDPQRNAPPVVGDREPQGDDCDAGTDRASNQGQPTPFFDIADQPASGQQQSIDPQGDLSRQCPAHACCP